MLSQAQFVLAMVVGLPVSTLTASLPNTAVRRYLDELSAPERTPIVGEIPSFSRQTGLPCNACHTSYPQLNDFGRAFKLSGYTLATEQTVEEKEENATALQLDLIPPLSAMLVASVTNTGKAQPEAQNGNVDFPQQLGLFIGGAITPHLGGFLQVTYDPAEGGIAMDNVDLRFAHRGSLGSRSLTYGFTLNNNPTVQDVWNTAPAWGYPYTSSAAAPTPAAAALIDGGLGQTVAGLGGYAFWNDLIYGEFAAYRSAPQGGANPPDATSESTLEGITPYWRLAVQRHFGSHYLELGTYGLIARLYPSGVSGPTDRYRDLALDAQYEVPLAGGTVAAHAIWIDEHQTLTASFGDGESANLTNTLRTLRIDGTYVTRQRIGITAGVLTTSGDDDSGLYAPDPVFGSRTGRPNSTGFLAELSWMPWLNTRFGLQYVGWSRFNGTSSNYDGSGRDAKDNNTLYLYTWLAF